MDFDTDTYRRGNEVERTTNRLRTFRAVSTRYDKRAYVLHGTVTLASIRLWIRPDPPDRTYPSARSTGYRHRTVPGGIPVDGPSHRERR
ncbi:hypothetical protein GCM10018781_23330 [Kitasatospora indigofera]|uniref:Transposase DDE domain-containing protein n=1 Tax=Kitasatospora indigofera TaxID=67307 RepID=A0A919FKC0_9ACTN|nr:hypothetical protein GCM10018781_23330 [Kitasatospora indigofera]